ncbi:hypothetical protein CN128_33320 [Sinorhizobium meliloti]|nr:hypothetical protein CDO24_32290 [Sinorhizobium meliloti]ASQ12663.1 hypothetical protein CDO22_21465 [Sinorhizobium meliloti]PTD30704.1 hypothetical protein C5N13_01025 [Sinorhizobium meliloti]RVH55914.1 hypothetical protein CN198_34850 [Sinorhizobium meliloti]RVI20638.1 hypothetical protein CN202_29850 [Sinorhizobium meliloti]
MTHDRDDHSLPDESPSTDENPPDTPQRTIANRRKPVGVIHEGDTGRLKTLEYLGRRWLSHR